MLLPLIIPPAAIMTFLLGIISAQQDESRLTERPYEVLLKQNLVMMGTLLAVLLLLMIIMAVCVYKPLTRR